MKTVLRLYSSCFLTPEIIDSFRHGRPLAGERSYQGEILHRENHNPLIIEYALSLADAQLAVNHHLLMEHDLDLLPLPEGQHYDIAVQDAVVTVRCLSKQKIILSKTHYDFCYM